MTHRPGHVACTIEDGIAHVRLDRPDKLNALTLDVLDELVSTARMLRRDRSIRAVVLSGEGDAFCAGLDFATVMRTPGRVAGYPARGYQLAGTDARAPA